MERPSIFGRLAPRLLIWVLCWGCERPAQPGPELPNSERATLEETEQRVETPSEQANASSCADRAGLQVAVRRALEEARSEGVPVQTLRRCDPERAVCLESGQPTAESAPEGCRIGVIFQSDRWEVRIESAPDDGAPQFYEAWISANGSEVGRTYLSANSWAVGGGGRLRIRGTTQRRRHTHGGAPARLGSAEFYVDNHTMAPVTIRVRSVEWLVDSSCQVPVRVAATLAASELALGAEPGGAQVTLPLSTTSLSVRFPVQNAYQSHCDRFAARVIFDAGGESLVAVAEWDVMRVTPLRR